MRYGVAVTATTLRSQPRRVAGHRLWIPRQHGAWAMLVVPFLAGLLASGFRWPDAPLFGAWLSGYPLSYFVLQAIRSRRPGRWGRTSTTPAPCWSRPGPNASLQAGTAA